MFDHCSNFTISGGTFNIWERPASPRSDFRSIRLGDLNLLKQVGAVQTLKSDVIDRRGEMSVVRNVVVGTRRVYRARIFGSQDPMTAVVYEGSRQIYHGMPLTAAYIEYQMARDLQHTVSCGYYTTSIRVSMGGLCLHEEFSPGDDEDLDVSCPDLFLWDMTVAPNTKDVIEQQLFQGWMLPISIYSLLRSTSFASMYGPRFTIEFPWHNSPLWTETC
ncbi:hypothetical protein FB451DRAFT_1404111 [Mycena latifolia]|nr:hypothetical protein FB451DRAFT_1404111 [Mycena latifolia]